MFVFALSFIKHFFVVVVNRIANCLIDPTLFLVVVVVVVFQEAADDVGSGDLGADEEVGHIQPPLLASLLHQVLFGPLVKR